MKIYTRTGDDGTTGLIGGQRIPKSDPRLECYGTIDELNASLGLALACVAGPTAALLPWLRTVQNELFVIGSHLAMPENSPHRQTLPTLEASMIQRLETQIDDTEKQLPALRNFILPGGTELSSRLHL